MKRILFSTIFCIISINLSSQAGIGFSSGLSLGYNNDSVVTPENTKHTGYFIGADTNLNSGKMYFIVGGQYQKLSFLASSENAFFENNPAMTYFNLRVGLGFEVINFSDNVKLNTKALGTINTLLSYPESFLTEPYDTFNTSTAGIVLGLSIDFSLISVFAEYNKGFVNAVNEVPNTEFDFISFGLAFNI